MAEQIKIAELSIDNKSLVASMVETKEAIEAVTAQNKRLATSGDKTSETFVKNEADLKTLKGEYAAQTKVLNATTNATVKLNSELNKEVKSLDGAAKNNKALKEVRNQLNVSTKEGAKQLAAINKKINENTDFIKANSSDLEKQKQNIGNYSSALDGISPQLGVFNQGLAKGKAVLGLITKAFSFYTGKIKEGILTMRTAAAGTKGMTAAQTAGTVATNLLSGALKILKFALIATGIGAIVVVLGSLVAMLANTQSGTDKVSQVMAALGAAFNVIIDRVSQFGGALVKFFSGDFAGGFEDMKASLSGIGEEMQREASEAFDLEKALQAVEDREISLIQTQAKRRAEIERLRLASKDFDKSAQERAQLLQESIEIEKSILNDELSIARERARISEAQVNQGESTRDEIRKNQELQAKVTDLETASLKRLRSIEAEKQGILKQGRGLEKAHRAEREAERKADANLTEKERAEQLKKDASFEELKRQAIAEAEIRNAEDEEARDLLKLEREFEKKELAIEKLMLDAEQEKELKLLLKQEELDAIAALEVQAADAKAVRDKATAAAQNKIDIAANKLKLDGLQALFEAESDIGKALLIAKQIQAVKEAGIALSAFTKDAALKASGAVVDGAAGTVKSAAAAPFPANIPLIAGFIASIGGLFGVIKNATTKGKSGSTFARGGLLSGASHANGGIPTPYGELEGGEAVINKRSTALFRPILSQLNEAGGGVKFASGGILDAASTGAPNDLFNVDVLAEKIAGANRALPAPVVAVSEIAEVSDRVGLIESAGDF